MERGARRTRLARTLLCAGLAVAWFISTLTAAGVVVGNRLVGLAFSAATGVAVASVVVVMGFLGPRRWRSAFRESRAFILIGGLFVAASLLSCVASDDRALSLAANLRLGATVLFGGAFIFARCVAPRQARESLGVAALVLVGFDVSLLVLGVLIPSIRVTAFEIGHHQVLGALPRFQGLAGTPSAAGLWALVALGLIQLAPLPPRLRAGGHALAALVVVASLSLATVALPIVLATVAARSQRLRRGIAIAGASFALAFLHTQPLGARVGSSTFTFSRPLPAWAEDDLGPKYMPIQQLRAPGFEATWIWTVYHYTTVRAFSCCSEHWAFGVGADRFEHGCPLVTMNTYGRWGTTRSPHNEYGGWLAERGLVGIVAIAAALVLGRRRFRLRSDVGPWLPAVLLGVATVALGGTALETLPAMGLLTATLKRRSRAG